MNSRIKLIIQYAKQYWLKFVFILCIIVITTIIVAMYPYLFGRLIDTLFYNKDMPSFLHIVLIYCIIFMINQLLHFILNMLLLNLRIKFNFDIKRSIFRKVISYECKDLTSLNAGDIIYRMNNDADEVLNFIYSDIFYGFSALLDMITCLGIIMFINLPFAGMALLLALSSFLLSKYFSKRLKPINEKLAKLIAINESWLYEFLKGMRDIKLLTATKRCINKYMRNDFNSIRMNNQRIKREVIAERSNATMQLISTLCIYGFSAYFIITKRFTLGGMIASIDYFNRIKLMMERLYIRTFTISKRMVAIDRIIEVENKQSEDYNSDIYPKSIKLGDIQFKDIVFSYNENVKILDNLSLHIKPGERVSIVGKSGAGKSTLAELLCRLYDVDEGEIIIDGTNIKDYNLQDLRRQIGIVHQETIIFTRTIRYNLVFSDDNKLDSKIWLVLKDVKMDEIVKKLPNGLDSVLDSTISLSGGQQQRLAIARLYLKNPQILIFDESTSALDERTEFDITETYREMFKNRTTLVIAHRFSTIIKSDKVAYMENGKVIGMDRHNKLLETCIQYNNLFLEQDYFKGKGENKPIA